MAESHGDRLFGGLTRPATVLGLPVEALLIILGFTAVVFLVVSMVHASLVWRLGVIGAGAVAYAVARLICTKDPRSFRYWGLKLTTKGAHRTRGFWKSGSYSPVSHRKR